MYMEALFLSESGTEQVACGRFFNIQAVDTQMGSRRACTDFPRRCASDSSRTGTDQVRRLRTDPCLEAAFVPSAAEQARVSNVGTGAQGLTVNLLHAPESTSVSLHSLHVCRLHASRNRFSKHSASVLPSKPTLALRFLQQGPAQGQGNAESKKTPAASCQQAQVQQGSHLVSGSCVSYESQYLGSRTEQAIRSPSSHPHNLPNGP